MFCVGFSFWAFFLRYTNTYSAVSDFLQDMGLHSGVFVVYGVVALTVFLILAILPALIFSFSASFRRWEKRRTAFAGGLAANFVWPIVASAVYLICRLLLYVA